MCWFLLYSKVTQLNIYIHSFLYAFPAWFIPRDWIQFPVLYGLIHPRLVPFFLSYIVFRISLALEQAGWLMKKSWRTPRGGLSCSSRYQKLHLQSSSWDENSGDNILVFWDQSVLYTCLCFSQATFLPILQFTFQNIWQAPKKMPGS